MQKLKMFLKITLILGISLFLLEAASFSIFKEKYRLYFGTFLNTGMAPEFLFKLLFINFVIAFLIIVIFDSIYESLPGGFLRKSINFAFLLWALQTIPFLLHFFISTRFVKDLFLIIFLQYLVIETIIAFIITGIYDEFYLKKREGKNKIEEKIIKKGEQKDETNIKNIPGN